VRLRVLVPAVDNVIAGDAFRPGDVLSSRKGLTVEIGNTDAEGRLVLADALALADEEAPDLLIDLATLTGAARVALGPDLPALFTDDQDLARDIAPRPGRERPRLAAAAVGALHLPVRKQDRRPQQCRQFGLRRVDHRGAVPQALRGAGPKSHAHFDIFAWTPSAQARPTLRRRGARHPGALGLIRERYGSSE
jgi:leucyl aminopeptidase